MKKFLPGEIINQNITTAKFTLTLGIIATIAYFAWWLNINNIGNPFLYTLLFIGEIYHAWQAIGYIFTIWNQEVIKHPQLKSTPAVDIFVTVCGEPIEIIRKTIEAAKNIKYSNFKIYILNDNKGRGLSTWKDVENLAEELKVNCITREKNIGAKAGNINNALKKTKAPLFVVFDADHVPLESFLAHTVGFFEDKKIALVQTPQYYDNHHESYLTEGAWEQQELFFGPICKGKNQMGGTFWCGTNAVVRRKAILEIGGIPEDNIAEDFLASLYMHEKGWKTAYLPEILAKGLAPQDLLSYVKQQFRWARGSLEITFKHNPFFKKNLTLAQKFQYAYSSSYYLNGIVILIDALAPIYVLFTNAVPVNSNTSDFVILFFPFIFITSYILMSSTRSTITFKAIQFSYGLFYVFLKALYATIFNINSKFEVTEKSQREGNFLSLATPHILYSIISVIAIIFAITRNGITPAVVTNSAWAVFNIFFFFGFIRAAYKWDLVFTELPNYIASLFGSVKNLIISPNYNLLPVIKDEISTSKKEKISPQIEKEKEI